MSESSTRPRTRSQAARSAPTPIIDQTSRLSQNTGPVTPPRASASAVPQHVAQMPGTPVVPKSSGTAPFTSNAHFSNPQLQRMAIEMKSKFIGPMRPQVFLDQFLPMPKDSKKPWNWNAELKAKSQDVAGQKKEVHIYQFLINALEVACDGNLVLVNTSAVLDPDAGILVPEGLKPDISAYESGYDITLKKVTNFTFMEVHMELKRNDGDDGFLDNGILSIGDPTTSDLLLQFFWRYGKMSLEARGKDLSVSRLTADEELEGRAGLELTFQDALLKFSVFDEDSKETRFLVGNEQGLKANSSATGRATRTYRVWDHQKRRSALLKDTWRVALPDMQKEGAIYKTLHEKGVPHISNVLCSGDVFPTQFTGADSHRTRTHTYATPGFIKTKTKWEKIEGLEPHSHYRIVLDTIGHNLTSFKSSKELVTAARDALEALFAAYDKAGVMHRHISVGNIMITDHGEGLLMDWDLAKAFILNNSTREPITGPTRQPDRSGTWQFISVRLLLTTSPLAHTLADDMESMLHVLSWIALKYMHHGMKPGDLASTLYRSFDAHHKDGNRWRGDRSKKTFLTGREIGGIGLQNKVVAKLLTDLAYVFAVQYEEAPPQKAFEKFKQLEKDHTWNECDDEDLDVAVDARRYTRRKNQYKNPQWMLKLFNDAIAKGPWSLDDPAESNELPISNDNELKRKDPDDPEDDEGAKRQKLDDNGEFMTSEIIQSLDP
ncbi:hypothetical protein Hypma_013848 [Hypsizygus marmoreus]|uniref:Fungal-type protein kinase domain-containing protein n=1 Tax=Hypsizygus marmoreus TaxID=39966 RepID=A0A369K7N5_HYPMA|nr:hypothetical protein Hypma_013848 [Hypsizygus marmoreus]